MKANGFAALVSMMVMLGINSAYGEVSRSTEQASPLALNHNEYVCTTYNRWYHYTSTSTSLKYAKHDAIHACVRDGGSSAECHHHLECSGSPSTPNPLPTPAPSPTPTPTPEGAYYDWGGSPVGYGYCFQYDKHDKIMHNGKGQPYVHCEAVKPSVYDWGYYPGSPGTHCFQWTPYGHVLNKGVAVSNRLCRH